MAVLKTKQSGTIVRMASDDGAPGPAAGVDYGSNPDTPRPDIDGPIIIKCTVEPNTWLPGDIWLDPSSENPLGVHDHNELYILPVDGGVNLSTARPSGAAVVYWMFDSGVDVGESGENIVNAIAGDQWFVADS